jgi:hypothetical protein
MNVNAPLTRMWNVFIGKAGQALLINISLMGFECTLKYLNFAKNVIPKKFLQFQQPKFNHGG